MSSAGESLQHMELSNIASVNVNCYHHLEELFGNCYLLNLTHAYPTIQQFQKFMCLCTKRNYRVIIAAVFVIAKNWKLPKFLSTVEHIGQIVVQSYNGLLQSNENEGIIAAFNNWDDSYKQYLVQDVRKEHTQYASNYIQLSIRNFGQWCYS